MTPYGFRLRAWARLHGKRLRVITIHPLPSDPFDTVERWPVLPQDPERDLRKAFGLQIVDSWHMSPEQASEEMKRAKVFR